MRLRVVRPIYVGGVRKEIGEIVELTNAGDALSTGRVVRAEVDPPPAPGPMTMNPVDKPVEQPVVEPPAEAPPVGKKRKFAQRQ